MFMWNIKKDKNLPSHTPLYNVLHWGTLSKYVENILAFDGVGEVTLINQCLKLTDIKVLHDFKPPNGMTKKEINDVMMLF